MGIRTEAVRNLTTNALVLGGIGTYNLCDLVADRLNIPGLNWEYPLGNFLGNFAEQCADGSVRYILPALVATYIVKRVSDWAQDKYE